MSTKKSKAPQFETQVNQTFLMFDLKTCTMSEIQVFLYLVRIPQDFLL